LQQHIEQGRKKGFTTCDQGYEEGVFSVAAPILSAPDRLFGAISIASPTSRVDRKVIESHGRAVRAAAARLAAGLGARSVARTA
jgi:DNA-binding IclR family transcriptional regulator